MTILLVVLIFGLLVFVHELGHFIVARKGGIEVDEFGFGFPPRLLGVRRGGTLYSINLIPFGGFVKMRGENGEDTTPGSFGAASFGRKMAVLLAGVVMNLLVAYGLFVYLAATGMPGSVQKDLGLPTAVTETAKRLVVVDLSADSPAAASGIKKGDVIISGNKRTFESETDLVEFNKQRAGEEVGYQIESRGQVREVSIKLRNAAEGEKSGYLGVTPLMTSSVSYGWQAPLIAAEATVKGSWLTVTGFLGAVGSALTRQQLSGVAGPVGVVALLDMVRYLGLSYLLFFIATISISLAALNALPIPALDGGRAAVLAVGRVMRRPVSARVEGFIHTLGFVLLIMFMLAVTANDIRNLL